MLDTQEFGDFLQSVGLRDFVGVPCSYLAPLINYAINEGRFVMSNNEGDAVAIASGISLAGHSALSVGNSSLGNHLRNPVTMLHCNARSSAPHSHSDTIAQSNTANTRIVECAKQQILECQDSGKIESKSKDFYSNADSCVNFSETDSRSAGFFDKADSSAKKPTTYGVVLMQNSGLSNALSPLTSLNHTFKIPILGFVSLRGERDEKGCNTDEPQHELLGVITDKILETCQIQYAFLDSSMESAKAQVERALRVLGRGDSFFFIVRDKTFSKVSLVGHSALSDKSRILHSPTAALTSSKLLVGSLENHDFSSQILECQETNEVESQTATNPRILDSIASNPLPTRLQALEILHSLALDSKALLLATTGKCGRELYEIQDSPNQLYMVGSMGCVSSLSLGIALKSPQKVIAIDGDSALLMRLGALSTNAYYARNLSNFCHILLDNESHDSTGGQFNLSPFVDFASVARHCGYVNVCVAQNLKEFEAYIKMFLGHSACSDFLESTILECQDSSQNVESQHIKMPYPNLGAYFIYLKIAKGSKDNLGRPKITPKAVAKRLQAYMQACNQESNNQKSRK